MRVEDIDAINLRDASENLYIYRKDVGTGNIYGILLKCFYEVFAGCLHI